MKITIIYNVVDIEYHDNVKSIEKITFPDSKGDYYLFHLANGKVFQCQVDDVKEIIIT